MAHMGHGTSNSNKIFLFNYLINIIQKRVTKNNRKKKRKTRQSPRIDISDFQLECAKNVSNAFLLAWFKFHFITK